MTGCGCALLIAVLLGGIVFMVFGSTDAGDPIEQAVVLVAALGALLLRQPWRTSFVPRRLTLIRARRA